MSLPLPERLQLLKPEDVARVLNCHISTVNRMVESGRLKGLYLMGPPTTQRKGKKGLRILPESLDSLLTVGPEEVEKFQEEAEEPSVEPVLSVPSPRRAPRVKGHRRAWETLPPP